ncbi:MAG: pilus assembly protein CpaD [Tardiphaga sp.]|jgi:pilus assembly protein CpaD|nr:pilus assembly protein CpaD [Tardiphaga sp.]MDB5548497.1 pilus assembly protein CpaD [Tardiphaga sp.]MDB5574466.1 pilus assembly protein CpaD [Tardiphaga sp.]MDB5626697.1 pilus assembly protein CpaD [Tardiphaga sp.]MDB5629733.1 pilus assembly protein CpaD [Tardiphaga sp.]
MTMKQPVRLPRGLAIAGVLLGVTMALGGCTHTAEEVTSSVPTDYRLRHPIAIQEGVQTTEVFVGTARGGLSAPQRADVLALAQNWLREGTGAITIDVPVDTPNARAAKDSYREVQALLVAAGVPPRGITTRNYKPDDPRLFATIRLNYPKITATVGPCGTWPEDLGPSIKNKAYLDNKPYFNLGCANQRNLAAMVDNPADLVQPRPETPAYTSRRSVVLNNFRKGDPTASVAAKADTDKSKVSSVGQ